MHVCESNEEWLALRAEGIGGSDASTILGINKYKSPVELWLERTGRVEPQDLSDNEAVQWGNRLESTVRGHFASLHPEYQVSELFATLISKDRPWAHANLDGVLVDANGEKGVLEIKTAGANRASDWKDGVPDYYLAQVTHYLSVTGWGYAWVAALIGGQQYVEYKVMRDEDDVRMVSEAVDTFWNDYVVKGVMPQIVGTSGESRAMLEAYGMGDGFVSPENNAHFDKLVAEYQDAKAKEKAYGDVARKMANDIRAMIGSNKGVISDVYKVTWVKSLRSSIDTKRLKAEHPEIVAEYETSSPRDGGLRISGAKK